MMGILLNVIISSKPFQFRYQIVHFALRVELIRQGPRIMKILSTKSFSNSMVQKWNSLDSIFVIHLKTLAKDDKCNKIYCIQPNRRLGHLRKFVLYQ